MRGNKRSFVVEVRRALGRSAAVKSASSFLPSDPLFAMKEQSLALPVRDLFQVKEDQLVNHQKTGRILQALDQLEPKLDHPEISLRSKKQPKPQEQWVSQRHDSLDDEHMQAGILDPKLEVLQSETKAKMEQAVSLPLAAKKKTRRHSKILARYVFGTLPLRGERWKQRLRFI